MYEQAIKAMGESEIKQRIKATKNAEFKKELEKALKGNASEEIEYTSFTEVAEALEVEGVELEPNNPALEAEEVLVKAEELDTPKTKTTRKKNVKKTEE